MTAAKDPAEGGESAPLRSAPAQRCDGASGNVPSPAAPVSAKQGVVIVVERDERLLVIQRAEGILAGGSWCFVGGAIEPGESQAAAAAREFAEEVGGGVRPVRKIWEYWRPDGGLLLHWWLAELIDDRLQANPAEVADFRWCTPDEVAALPTMLDSNRLFLAALATGAIDLCISGGDE